MKSAHGKASPRRRSAGETEGRVLRAAAEVFGRKGYFDTTVDDIVGAARLSRGAFYLYFKNKDDVFARLAARTVEDMFAVSAGRPDGTLRQRVESGTRGYLEAFQRHRHVMRCLYQAGTANPEMAALHNRLRTTFITRIRRHLAQNIAGGSCHPMNPDVASYALGLMVDAFAYLWLSVGYHPPGRRLTLDTAVQELTNLWCRAVYRDGVAGGGARDGARTRVRRDPRSANGRPTRTARRSRDSSTP